MFINVLNYRYMLLIWKDISVNIKHLLMSVLFMIMMDGLGILAEAKSKM